MQQENNAHISGIDEVNILFSLSEELLTLQFVSIKRELITLLPHKRDWHSIRGIFMQNV